MEVLSDWAQDNAVHHEFLKDFMLAWVHHERSNMPCHPPDLVRVTGLLQSLGFGVIRIERMEGESWAPGNINGCVVDIQCPVSKTKITLSAPEAICQCKRSEDAWSSARGGGTAGMANMNHLESKLKIAMPKELSPGKSAMVRICMNSLISIIWPRGDEKTSFPYHFCERVAKSLDGFYQKMYSSGIETPSHLYNSSKDEDSMLTSSPCSLSSSPRDNVRVKTCFHTPKSTISSGSSSDEWKQKNVQRLSLPSARFQPKSPAPSSPYWKSATARGKKYAEMVKLREAEKNRSK